MVGPQVDHTDGGRQLGGKRRRLAVRQSEEDQVEFGQRRGIGGGEHLRSERTQPRVHRCDRLARFATGRDDACFHFAVTGQQPNQVAFYNHGDIKADHPEKMKRVPFNANNPDGPLEICLCSDCNAVLMLDDKQKRIRVAVPNVMGYDVATFPKATYHAFYDDTKGYPKPDDGRPVYEGLQPSFVWPKGA